MKADTNTLQAVNKTLGYSRNRTQLLNQFKSAATEKRTRFQKKSPNSSGNAVIELHSHNQLPPKWVDIYEETLENLKQIDAIKIELQKLISQRIRIQFEDHSRLDKQIKETTFKATRILKECEENLDNISRHVPKNEHEDERKIRINIQKVLAAQISDHTLYLHKQQKDLYTKLKAFGGVDEPVSVKDHEYLDEKVVQEMEAMDEIAKERDEAINQIIETINELSHIFKKMDHLVIYQGTVLDRIDYELEKTVKHHKDARKQLVRADEKQKSSCARNCIIILVILNLFFAAMLFLKYRHHHTTKIVIVERVIKDSNATASE